MGTLARRPRNIQRKINSGKSAQATFEARELWWVDSGKSAQECPSYGGGELGSGWAHIERFMKSVKHECLNRLIFFGDGQLRNAVS